MRYPHIIVMTRKLKVLEIIISHLLQGIQSCVFRDNQFNFCEKSCRFAFLRGVFVRNVCFEFLNCFWDVFLFDVPLGFIEDLVGGSLHFRWWASRRDFSKDQIKSTAMRATAVGIAIIATSIPHPIPPPEPDSSAVLSESPASAAGRWATGNADPGFCTRGAAPPFGPAGIGIRSAVVHDGQRAAFPARSSGARIPFLHLGQINQIGMR